MSARSTRWFASPDADITNIVAAEFNATSNEPKGIGETPVEVARALVRIPVPRNVDLVLRWNRAGRDLAIVESGVADRTIDESGVVENLITWTQPTKAYSWVTEAWSPLPRVRASSEGNGIEAVVVSVATLFALGVRSGDGSQWYMISNSPQAASATQLARWIGVDDVDGVSGFVDPSKVRLSTVLNAISVSVNIHPVGTTKIAVQNGSPDITVNALKAWMPKAQVHMPELQKLPPSLSRLLQQRMKRSEPRSSLTIGARVEQIVTVDGGQVWRHEAILTPSHTDARQISYSTRLPLDHGIIDREGHFGPDGEPCAYCHARICGACTDGLVACDCCSAAICKRCVNRPHGALWLCPACSSMRPATRSEARQHGRILLTRGMLIGIDHLHVVVVERAKEHWTRQGELGLKAPLLNASLNEFLNERSQVGDRSSARPPSSRQ